MAELGYGSTLLVDNLETLLTMIMVYIFMWIGALIVFLFSRCCNCCMPALTWTLSFLMWNTLLRFFLEGYLELSIDTFIDIRFFEISADDTAHHYVSHVLTMVILLYLLVLPFFIAIFLYKHSIEELEEQETVDKYGSVYEGLKVKRKQGLSYYVTFTVRRFFFAATLVFAVEMPWLQIMIAVVSVEAVIIYLGLAMPWEEQGINYLEIANEVILMLLLYHMILFTEFYPDYEVRAAIIGPSFLLVVAANIIFNVVTVVSKQWTTMRRGYNRWTNERRYL